MSFPGELGAVIEHPTMCLRCGYELRGLAPTAVCPECGLPIADSLERRRLGLSSPAYLASLRTGATLLIAALAISIIAGVARWRMFEYFFNSGPQAQKLSVGLDLAGTALLVAGVWMLTIDDPGLHRKDQARPNKRSMRAAGVGLVCIALIELLVAWRVPLPGPLPGAISLWAMLLAAGIALAGFACWLTLATGLVNYARWLAVRIPDEKLLRMTRTMAWCLPAALVLAFVASAVFGSATRILPEGLMALLVGAVANRIRHDRLQ